MFDPERWTLATVTDRTSWAEGLFTVHLDEARDFHGGQFTKLGLEVDGDPVSRAYSIASAPGAPLEFYVVAVEGGALSPRLEALRPGDTVWVQNKQLGGFTAERVPDSRDLWLIGTGTGTAPYISMLRHREQLARFDNVVIVQGARYAAQLGYADELRAATASGRVRVVNTVTREDPGGTVVSGRITTLFADGRLEDAAGMAVDGDHAHVMLCGNPAMIKEMRSLLQEHRGMTLHTPRRHGRVHIERYW